MRLWLIQRNDRNRSRNLRSAAERPRAIRRSDRRCRPGRLVRRQWREDTRPVSFRHDEVETQFRVVSGHILFTWDDEHILLDAEATESLGQSPDLLLAGAIHPLARASIESRCWNTVLEHSLPEPCVRYCKPYLLGTPVA
jgi:hypothetical protein